MSKPYPHRRLATKSTVRLIKLEELKVVNRIACKIRHAEHSNAEYDALSYVWGDDTPRRDIFIYNDDDQEWNSLRVHENLWQFLDNAWQRKIFDRWLWTDCICLNQKDSEEKREQIPRMADIFYSAKRVIACLGMSVSQGEHLLPVRHVIQEYKDWFWRETNFSEESILAAKAVIKAEYWERAWIVQEVVSSKDSEIVFFIGNIDMTFHEVRELRCFDDSKSRCDVHRGIMSCARILTDGHSPKVDLGILLAFVASGRFKSQQPHDLVYGIFGLVANHSEGTSPLEHIEIDYDKPPADVFLDAMLESLKHYAFYTDYPLAIALLLERPDNAKIWEPIFTFLARYTESSRTSQRHRNLARLILSVSDALYIIPSTSGSPPVNCYTDDVFLNLITTIRSAFSAGDVELTVEFSAFMLGLGISLKIYDERMSGMSEDWIACRRSTVQASSPWRCAAHQLSVRSGSPFQHIDRLSQVVRSQNIS